MARGVDGRGPVGGQGEGTTINGDGPHAAGDRGGPARRRRRWSGTPPSLEQGWARRRPGRTRVAAAAAGGDRRAGCVLAVPFRSRARAAPQVVAKADVEVVDDAVGDQRLWSATSSAANAAAAPISSAVNGAAAATLSAAPRHCLSSSAADPALSAEEATTAATGSAVDAVAATAVTSWAGTAAARTLFAVPQPRPPRTPPRPRPPPQQPPPSLCPCPRESSRGQCYDPGRSRACGHGGGCELRPWQMQRPKS